MMADTKAYIAMPCSPHAAMARQIGALGGATTGPQITTLGWWLK